MAAKDKLQCPIRLYRSDYDRLKVKTVADKVTFQKLAEVLFMVYLKGDKHIQALVTKYADEHSSKKRRYALDEIETNELLRVIEEEHSPLRHLEKLSKEISEEDGQDLHNRNRF